MSLNLSRYEFTKTPANKEHSWTLDDRHVQGLHALALGSSGEVVEIGCFRGRSTVAFTQALDAGADFNLHLVDVNVTNELRRVVSMCRNRKSRGNIKIHEMHSTSFALYRPSLVMIDGDHSWPAVLDVLNALTSGAEIIVMHDTRAHQHGFSQCEGASLAAEALRNAVDRPWIEDSAVRAGEMTHRGLLASFTPQSFARLGQLFSDAIFNYQA